MSSANLIRLSGLAAALFGVTLVLSSLLNLTLLGAESASEAILSGSWAVGSGLSLLAGVLGLLGLVGLYAYQAEASGVLGLVGFLVAFLGMALLVGVSWTQAFAFPTLALEAPAVLDAEEVAGPLTPAFSLSLTLASLGWVLFGVVMLRARVYPRLAVLALNAGAAISLVPLPGTPVVLGAAVAWLGFTLFTGRGTSAEQPSRVR